MENRFTEKKSITRIKNGEKVAVVALGDDENSMVFDQETCKFYRVGEPIDRLCEYEDLGYTPAELRGLISLSKPKPLTIDQIYSLGQSTSLYKDIHAIIDDGMKKRDRAVSIFFGSQGISIDITPFPEVEEIKEERDERR